MTDRLDSPLRRQKHGAVSVLQNSAHLFNRRRDGNLAASDCALRIDLARLPVGVLPGGVAAVEVELDAAQGCEAAALISAVPCLIDGKSVVGTSKGESGLVCGG